MVDERTVRRGYDDIAEIYAAERSQDGTGTDILTEFLDSLTEPERILDAGCGQGTPVLRRVCTRASAIGVDFSREQLVLAAESVPAASHIQGDMTRLPVRDETFDAITAFHSLIHIPDEKHQSVIDEFARVLRPGGRVLLTEGQEEWCGRNPDWLHSGTEMQWNIAGAAATRNHLRNAGFTIRNEWGDTDGTDDEHWVFFSAQLDG